MTSPSSPNPIIPPVELYGIHDRGELEAYCRHTKEYGVKPEVEAFHYGGIWNAMSLVKMGLLDTPVWTTFFLGWPGGCWTPPTVKVDAVHAQSQACGRQLQRECHGSAHSLEVLTQSILLGGHVRVGMEDNPYLDLNRQRSRAAMPNWSKRSCGSQENSAAKLLP